MYFSPIFLQDSLYVVALVLIIFMVGITIFKLRHHLKLWDKSMTLAAVVLLNTFYSMLTYFFNLPYELNAIITGGLSLVAFGYIVVILWELFKNKKKTNKDETKDN
ncbi:hypothetical protein [Companilactobacillus versmoldensis]|uniref:Integral membrane protein n=1 Tax=Companilactobacillus versmoldensis DSM 14857 = KCTC 3814 TaxID=1423815 RepID=A0A0R1SAR4_9LACO|nr:hypothetical protein [Companilactobacillus versmoldensis]KRL65561.1 hypothetical protein FC27_GL001553 [Companilactobacillus versmoldensis DSM 14857 = KCTC 3814]